MVLGAHSLTVVESPLCRRRLLRWCRQAPHLPTMFLSGVGLYRHPDPRRTSVPAAVSVALRSGLAGLVLPAIMVSEQPAEVAAAVSQGLHVLTYGQWNNSVELVRRHAREVGVCGVCVDNVSTVLAGLARS